MQADVDAAMADFAEGLGDLFDTGGDDGVPIGEELARLDGVTDCGEAIGDMVHEMEGGALPWNEINALVEQINWIGQDPKGFLTDTRQGIVSELRAAVNDIDQGLDEVKRSILKELREQNQGRGWEGGSSGGC